MDKKLKGRTDLSIILKPGLTMILIKDRNRKFGAIAYESAIQNYKKNKPKGYIRISIMEIPTL